MRKRRYGRYLRVEFGGGWGGGGEEREGQSPKRGGMGLKKRRTQDKDLADIVTPPRFLRPLCRTRITTPTRSRQREKLGRRGNCSENVSKRKKSKERGPIQCRGKGSRPCLAGLGSDDDGRNRGEDCLVLEGRTAGVRKSLKHEGKGRRWSRRHAQKTVTEEKKVLKKEKEVGREKAQKKTRQKTSGQSGRRHQARTFGLWSLRAQVEKKKNGVPKRCLLKWLRDPSVIKK